MNFIKMDIHIFPSRYLTINKSMYQIIYINSNYREYESIEEERYDLLDHWLMWYGGFNATLIGKILGMTRQNVSILIRIIELFLRL